MVLFYMLLENLPEFGKGTVVVDTPHALLDLQKTQRILSDPYLALPLIGVHPMFDFAKVLAQQAVDVLDGVGLDGVGRLEGASELLEQVQLVKGQGLLQPFHQQPGGAAARLLQFAVDREQGL